MLVAFIERYSLLSSRITALISHVILNEQLYPFFINHISSYFLISTEVMYRQHYLVVAWLVPRETAALSAQVLCTPFNHALCGIQSHKGRVHVCLAVTCRPHFWQNDRDLLRATAVTRGWNWYRNKSQHGKLTLEKKIMPPLLWGLEPGTFQSGVWYSNHRSH